MYTNVAISKEYTYKSVTNEWTNRRRREQTNRRMDEQTKARTDERTNVRTDEGANRRTDEWTKDGGRRTNKPFLRGYGPLNSFICPPSFVRPSSVLRHALIRILFTYRYIRAHCLRHYVGKVLETLNL